MSEIRIFEATIYGNPVPQPRHRVAKNGGRFLPKGSKVQGWKDVLRMKAQEWVDNGGKMFSKKDGDVVQMNLIFWFDRPKSIPDYVERHFKRPDIDNLAKAVQDALEGVVYEDDSQIYWLLARKYYVIRDAVPRVEISCEALND